MPNPALTLLQTVKTKNKMMNVLLFTLSLKYSFIYLNFLLLQYKLVLQSRNYLFLAATPAQYLSIISAPAPALQ